MPRRYPAALRRKVLDLVEADRSVAVIAEQLGVSGQTILWLEQSRSRGPRAAAGRDNIGVGQAGGGSQADQRAQVRIFSHQAS